MTKPRYPTIKDVAARAGVSKSLVSRALRGEAAVADQTRRRIQDAAAELGYRPNAAARAMAANKSDLIGIVVTGLFDPFWSDVVQAIDREAAANGRSALYMSGAYNAAGSGPAVRRTIEYREAEAIERLLEHRIDGLGVGLSGQVDLPALEKIARITPLVAMLIDLRSAEFDTVGVDEATAMMLAVRHLTELGHREIVFLGDGDLPGTRARVRGYRQAMRDAGLDKQDIVYPCSTLQGDGFEVMSQVVASGPVPSAVIAVTDGVARGAVSALVEAGLSVPGDVSVIGVDDSLYAVAAAPLLTTIQVPRQEIGSTTARLLNERIEGRATATTVMLRPSLVVRDSTAPRRQTASSVTSPAP